MVGATWFTISCVKYLHARFGRSRDARRLKSWHRSLGSRRPLCLSFCHALSPLFCPRNPSPSDVIDSSACVLVPTASELAAGFRVAASNTLWTMKMSSHRMGKEPALDGRLNYSMEESTTGAMTSWRSSGTTRRSPSARSFMESCSVLWVCIIYSTSMQNHRGAMMELGEGLCKLRKMDLENGPFFQFEEEVSATLEFLYQTQKELAACTSEICLPMDGSEISYQLLGSFAAGQQLYKLSLDQEGAAYITFSFVPEQSSYEPLKVKVPTLHATEDHLRAFEHR
ncbi:hypothetical protein ZIOFF_053205 [Zingiber officinale]|uniref:Uncharacterized protein n=1 Tax=Zingiber officinale TaxID=94328 RepID=A0A8J5KIB5_ZINOF|nr:hypothetical protein ZIOFF_053205 [Zingiber officinale]